MLFFSAVGIAEFQKADTKLYVPIVALSIEDNVKQLKQYVSGFKRNNKLE